MIIRIAKKLYRLLKMKSDPIGYARSIGVKVGNDCLILDMTEKTFGSEPYLITLGDHVALASGAAFMTHDGGAWVMRLEYPETDLFGQIVVGNNVLVGLNVVIMPGVTIGNNCIVAAGSVVTRDVPDGMIVGGVPAKQLKPVKDYMADALKRSLPTKHLSSEAKKEYLLKHFRLEESV